MVSSRSTRGYGFLEGFLARQRSKVADKLIPSGHRKRRILDVGCGAYPFFLSSTKFSEKYGLDKIVQESDVSRLRAQNITLINCEIEKEDVIPFDSEFFDVVTMLAVVEHIEPRRLAKLFGEIRRVLRPAGVFIMTTPAGWTDALLRLMAKLRFVSAVEIGEHKDAYSPLRLCSILTQASFPEENLRYGYFEMFANTWIRATK